MKLRLLVVLISAFSLQGCAAGVGLLLIPDDVILEAVDGVAGTNYAALSREARPLEGNDCLPVGSKVGGKVHKGGKTFGIIKEIYGTSPNCPYNDMPLRALVVVD
jgi:hypothetical protein